MAAGAGVDVEKPEPLRAVGGSVNWCSHFSMGVTLKATSGT